MVSVETMTNYFTAYVFILLAIGFTLAIGALSVVFYRYLKES